MALLLIAGVSVGLTCYATREGVGLSPDADSYLTMARQLAAGEGLRPAATSAASQASVHYPPLYPMLLAGLSRAGMDLMSGARLLNLVAFAGVVVLAGLIFHLALGLGRAASLLGAAMLAVSRDLLYIHSMVLSDGVFLFLLLLGWLLLDRYLKSKRMAALILAGVVIALAMLTRYVGAALAVAACLTLLAIHRRVKDAIILGAISCLPLAAWIARNISQSGSAVNRELVMHPPGKEQWQRAAETVAQWLWPTPKQWLTAAGVITVIVLGVVAALSARNARREGRPSSGGGAWMMLCFAACYAVIVLATVFFLDAHTRLDFRILAPLQLAIAMPIFAELARSRLPASAGRWAQRWPAIMTSVFVIFLAGQAARSVAWARQAPELYVGYSMLKWRNSDTLRYVNTLPADALIYTNATALLRIHTGRSVKSVPAVIDPRTLQPPPELDRRLRAMERDLTNRGGFIIYFDEVRRPALISSEQLQREVKLRSVYRGRDGEVLQLRLRKRD